MVGIAGFVLISILLSGSLTLGKSDTEYTYNYGNYFEKQHFLKQIGMPLKLALPKEGVTVAVIDIGMDLKHPAYRNKLLKSDFKGEDAVYLKEGVVLAHGTAIASIIAAESDEMLGVAPNVKILPVLIGLPYPKGYEDIATTYYKMKPEEFLDLLKDPEKLRKFKEFGKIRTEIILKNTANAIKYAADHGAKIICMSITTVNETRYIEDAVKYACSKGVIIIAPTGNDTRYMVYYPARFEGVIAVGGVNEDDEWWYEKKARNCNSFPNIKILILDEPTAGLDPLARREFLGLIQEMREEGKTILLVTHIGADAEIASKVCLMNEGKIVAEGTPEELKKKSGLKHVLNVETPVKSGKVRAVLSNFGEKGLLETDTGYRIYCDNAENVSPEIVRALDKIGYKIMKIGIEKPTLEDAFFKMTKKENRDEIDERDNSDFQ